MLTREQLNEQIIKPFIMERLEDPINRALEDSACAPEEIEEILLIGGSSKVPHVK